MQNEIEKINLIPKSYRQEQKAKRIQQSIIALLLLEVIGFYGVAIEKPKRELAKLEMQLATFSENIEAERYSLVNQKLTALEETQQEVEKWNEIYAGIKAKQFVTKVLIEDVLECVPEGLSHEMLSVYEANLDGQRQMILRGTGEDALAIMEYITRLESIFGIGTIESEFEWSKEQNNYPYNITIDLSREETGDD